MKRRLFLQNAAMLGAAPLVAAIPAGTVPSAYQLPSSSRKLWLNYLEKLAHPVLSSLAADQLKEKMPVEAQNPALVKERTKYTHLEAFGRVLAGIAPWLHASDLSAGEKQLQGKYFQLA